MMPRRYRTISPCYNCGEFGHLRNSCPRLRFTVCGRNNTKIVISIDAGSEVVDAVTVN